MFSHPSPGAEPARPGAHVVNRHRWITWLAVGMAVAGGALVAAGWLARSPQPVHAPTRLRDIEEWHDAAAPAPGYLGMQACVPCHANRVAEFSETRHFQACRVPKPGEMPVGFQTGKGSYATRNPALHFEMVQVGDAFFQTSVQGEPTEKRVSAPIALVYGGGGVLDEVYFTWHDTRLYELPVAWLHPQNRWAITTDNLRGEGDFARDTTPRCLECHNTWFEHVPGTRNQYNRASFILGVTCEKCHGPGRDHVAFHQANPNADTGHAVINPGHLTSERLTEVCTQCHSNAIYPRTRAFQYRPGEPLDDYYKTIVTRHPENDHVANQAQYMRESKCFKKSDTLTCVTCHNPHRPADAAKRGSAQRSCVKCHKAADCPEQPRLPLAVRDNCVGCHMPARVWMNVYFHTEDDQYVPPIRRSQHRIAVDRTATREVLLAWYRAQGDEASKKEVARLTADLVEHWLAEAERRKRDHRLLAAIGAYREAMRVDPSAAIREKLRQVIAVVAKVDADMAAAVQEIDQRRLGKAIDALSRVLALKPDLAAAHGKLGTAYSASGQSELAVKHLQAVAQHDANDPYGYMMLGWLAYLRGDGDDAVAAYRMADEIEPFNSKTHYHWGLALAKLGKLPEAVRHFQQVLKIDPDHAGACQALGSTLRQLGQPAEAVSFAKRAARLTLRRNPDVLLTLAEAYADGGRFADAVAAAEGALDAAQASNPDLAPQIRWRIDQWRGLAKTAAK